MVYMDAIPKFDIKSVIKSDIKFDISIKPTTWKKQCPTSCHQITTVYIRTLPGWSGADIKCILSMLLCPSCQ